MLYVYKARDKKGLIKTGEIEAESEVAAYNLIKNEGLSILALKESRPKKKLELYLPFLKKVSLANLTIFTKELEVMTKAGLPISGALESLFEQTQDKKLKAVAKKIQEEVEEGTPLSMACSQFPEIFSPFYVNSLKAGETTGRLDQSLASLSFQLEKDNQLASKIKGALLYPILIFLALIGVVLIILLYVIPALSKLFEELNTTLPFFTRFLIGTSNLTIKFWPLFLILIFGIYLGIKFYQKTEKGRWQLDLLKIRLPLLGSLIKKIYLARFCRVSQGLIKAGLPMLEVLKTSSLVLTNVVYRQDLAQVQKQVEQGIPLSKALSESKNFPVMIPHLIAVGEESGNLEEVLDTLATFYEREVENTTRNLTSLIEPILIILIGIAVALVIFSVIRPIYALTETL